MAKKVVIETGFVGEMPLNPLVYESEEEARKDLRENYGLGTGAVEALLEGQRVDIPEAPNFRKTRSFIREQ